MIYDFEEDFATPGKYTLLAKELEAREGAPFPKIESLVSFNEDDYAGKGVVPSEFPVEKRILAPEWRNRVPQPVEHPDDYALISKIAAKTGAGR